MLKSVEDFLSRARANTPACKEYLLKVNHAGSKAELFGIALEMQSLEFLCRAMSEGWGMTADEICRDFAPYINGEYVYEGKYTSELYCRHKGRIIGKSTVFCFASAVGFALALILASLGNLCEPINKVLAPIITILRAAPTVAVILIMYAFMANDKLAIVVGLLIAFPILYSAFYSAIENVDKDLIEMAKIYKVRPMDRILSIYLPSVTPTLFDMSKSTLSLTFKVVVASEILTSIPMSIGTSIKQAQNIFDMEYLLAWTIASIVIAFILEGIVSLSKFIWRKTR